MATKKYVCKVCGYTHEGNEAPSVCPLCKAGASEFDVVSEGKAAKKKGLNTNSDIYAIVYSVVLVVIVAFFLAFANSALKDKQEANVRLDKKKQILSSLNIDVDALANPAVKYDEVFADDIKDPKTLREYIIKVKKDNTYDVATAGGFDVPNDSIGVFDKDGVKRYPLYVAKIGGETKYVVPVVGNGLWGAIWGYIALNDDCNTIYGVYFSHASETPGLGAEIAGEKFQKRFTEKVEVEEVENGVEVKKLVDKRVFDKDGKVALTVEKAKNASPEFHIDAVSGATITCNGVDDMLKRKLAPYREYLKAEGEKNVKSAK